MSTYAFHIYGIVEATPRFSACFFERFKTKMFDDWCGLDFGKYAFPLMILGSLALHVWDVTSDVLVAIVLYNEDIVYFGVSTGIMVLGSLFSSFASVFFGSLRSAMKGEDPDGHNDFPRIDADSCCSCLFGLTQLEMFVDAYYSIRLGKKTRGFVITRLFEGMIESAPQALLQLYIVLKRADGVIDTNDILFFASIGTSVLSMAVGVSQFEKWEAKNSSLFFANKTAMRRMVFLVNSASSTPRMMTNMQCFVFHILRL